MTNTKLESALKEFAKNSDEWFKKATFLADNHKFFESFFKPTFLANLTWEQIQEMGDHLHSANALAIAKKNAFGRPNHDIEHYKNTFNFLAHGAGTPEERIRRVTEDAKFSIKYLGDSMWSEIFGYIFPEKFVFKNSRSDFAVSYLGISTGNKPSSSWVDNFILFNEALSELRSSYLTIVGRKTALPLNLELDQFFSFIYETQSQSKKQYWWLNCNPKMWDPRGRDTGSLQTYTTHNEDGNERRVYKHFKAVRPGDYLVGYITSPVQEVSTLFEITKGIFTDSSGNEAIEFKKLKDYEPITRDQLTANPLFAKCDPLRNNQGSLFALKKEEFVAIENFEEIDSPPEVASSGNNSDDRLKIARPFSIEDGLKDVFLTKDTFVAMIEALKYKKNIILQGPPGVGKTFSAKRLAYSLIGHETPSRIGFVQFHPSYAYEDFVQGIRPIDGGFRLKDGIFMDFCAEARKSDLPFVVIIDEINRGNLAKIFGELLVLIEADKRNERVRLAYSENGAEFSIPENLYIIGTMNTADRSLSMVDYALRRRFMFFLMKPEFSSERFIEALKGMALTTENIRFLQEKIGNLNSLIESDRRNLGPGFEIGHSYFSNKPSGLSFDQWFTKIVKMEIEPLLKEYWYDDLEKVNEITKTLKVA